MQLTLTLTLTQNSTAVLINFNINYFAADSLMTTKGKKNSSRDEEDIKGCLTLKTQQWAKSIFSSQYHYLLDKHQWNTRWAFTRKLHIFTCENNMLSSHVKISPLLWLHPFHIKKLLNWNGLVVNWCLYNK